MRFNPHESRLMLTSHLSEIIYSLTFSLLEHCNFFNEEAVMGGRERYNLGVLNAGEVNGVGGEWNLS